MNPNHAGVTMSDEKEAAPHHSKPSVPVENFSGKDVTKIAKEVGHTTVVWTLAGIASQFLRDLMNRFLPKRK